MLLRYDTKIDRPAWGRSLCRRSTASSNLYRITPSVSPPSTSKFDVRRHADFRTQCSFARRRIVWSSWLCFTHDETRLSGRRARNSPSSVQNPTEPSVAGLACRSRAPSLAMDDAFRAGASSKTRTSVSRDDAAVLVGGMELLPFPVLCLDLSAEPV